MQALPAQGALHQSPTPGPLHPSQGTLSSLTSRQSTSKEPGVLGEIPQPIRDRGHYLPRGAGLWPASESVSGHEQNPFAALGERCGHQPGSYARLVGWQAACQNAHVEICSFSSGCLSREVRQQYQLSEDQRYILRTLVEQENDRRGAALFALGYWAGCRVSDLSWLQMAHTHVGPKVGWVHIGYKGGKWRDIDLMNEVRKPLYEYLRASRDPDRIYVFTSQRSERLTEEGIHYWFRMLKARATKGQWEYIHNLTFHDLRHDFAHRAREAGWSLEEVAYYLGHITKKGTPAIQTTVRYTQVSREQVKEKLKNIKG